MDRIIRIAIIIFEFIEQYLKIDWCALEITFKKRLHEKRLVNKNIICILLEIVYKYYIKYYIPEILYYSCSYYTTKKLFNKLLFKRSFF